MTAPQSSISRRSILIAGALVAGCTTQGTANIDSDAGMLCAPGAGAAQGDLPCDVAAVLVAKCQPCHRRPPKNHAPFPEVTYEDLQQPFGNAGLQRWQRMSQVISPGQPDGSVHMPPAQYPQLDSAELQTLLAWFAQCAPPLAEGSGCDPHPDGGLVDGNGPDSGAPDAAPD